MITSFQIANFKSFGPQLQNIPLKPITLIFGPNSAGKSSLIHSLLWLSHIQQTGEVSPRNPKASNGKVDLGGFYEFVHRRDTSKRVMVNIDFTHEVLTEAGLDIDWIHNSDIDWCESKKSGEVVVTIELTIGMWPGTTDAQLLHYRVSILGEEFFSATWKRGRLEVNTICLETLFDDSEIKALLDDLIGKERGQIIETIDKTIARFYPDGEKRDQVYDRDEAVPEIVDLMQQAQEAREEKNIALASLFALEVDQALPCSVHLKDGLYNESKTGEVGRLVTSMAARQKITSNFTRFLKSINAKIHDDIGSMEYVPPLRDLPDRFFDLTQADAVWKKLFRDKKLLDKINAWLGQKSLQTRYALEVMEYFPRYALEQQLPGALQSELAHVTTSMGDYQNYAFYEELGSVVDELKEKFLSADMDKLLEPFPYIREILIDSQRDVYNDDPDAYYDREESGREWGDLSSAQKEDYVKNAIVYEAWINEDTLASGAFDSAKVFAHFCKDQDSFKELIERYGDQDKATADFLDTQSAQIRDIRREITLRHLDYNTRVSLQDVGVGISQVLPVLLHAYGDKNSTIAIEQPEIHIHPALQAEIGDLFIESALGENKNTFVIETHSEHLILRILKRIKQTTRNQLGEDQIPITPDDVAVLYVQPGENGATVKELRVDGHGRFKDDWPNGFFEERFNEEF